MIIYDHPALHLTMGFDTVVIFKNNGKDIRLCIGYRRIKHMIRLTVYSFYLISELL